MSPSPFPNPSSQFTSVTKIHRDRASLDRKAQLVNTREHRRCKLTNPKITCPSFNSRLFFSPNHSGSVLFRPSSMSTAFPPVTKSPFPCAFGSAVTWMMYFATSSGVFIGMLFFVHSVRTPERSCVSVAQGPERRSCQLLPHPPHQHLGAEMEKRRRTDSIHPQTVQLGCERTQSSHQSHDAVLGGGVCE